MSRLLTTSKYENIGKLRTYQNKIYMQNDYKLMQINKQGAVIKNFMIPTNNFIISEDFIYTINPRKYNIDIYENNTKLTSLTQHCGAINSLALDKDSNSLYSGACDKTLKIWDMNTYQLITSIMYSSRVYNVKIFNDKLYVALERTEIKVYNIHTMENIMNFESKRTNRFIEITNDGKKLISISRNSNYDNQIIIWDTQTGKKIFELEKSEITRYTSTLLHNDILYLGVSEKIGKWECINDLKLFDIHTHKIIFQERVNEQIESLCMCKNKLYTSERITNTLYIWDMNLYFTPTINCFKRLSEEWKNKIRLISHIRERYDTLDYGLPPEIWFYILEMCRTI